MMGILLAIGLGAVSGGVEAVPVKEYVIELAVYQGDPLGSRDEGTVRCVAEPILRTRAGCPAQMLVGGQTPVKTLDGKVTFYPYGLQMKLTPTAHSPDAVWLDAEFTRTEANPGFGIVRGEQVIPGFTEQTRRVGRVVKLGERVRTRITVASPTDQTWAEWTVRPAQ